MATTVTWVRDANGNHEVSSPEHLKQLMHKGTLYTDAGAPPSSYWAADTSYLQTADIDFLSDSTDITPIGIAGGDAFFGIYDGGEFHIYNWSYVDPQFSTANDCVRSVGLFGTGLDCALKNIRLGGLWTIQGFQDWAGFLCGLFSSRTDPTRGIWNIECDFSVGSFMDTNPGIALDDVGGVVGSSDCPAVTGVTLKGSIDFLPNTHNPATAGGVFGRLSGGTTITQNNSGVIQNLAAFPSGINGRTAGGVVGNMRRGAFALVNAMVGDVNGTSFSGGIAGAADSTVTGVNDGYDTLLNAMTGNISNTADTGTGGIFGLFTARNSHVGFMNYMSGDISTSSGDTTQVGGIIGRYRDLGDSSLTSSINAMNGNVEHAVLGVIGDGTPTIVLSRNSAFGLTFNTDNHGTTAPPSGLLTNSDFTDLPYNTLTGTDTDGLSYDFDFVYANLSGNANFSEYTHLILHKGDLCTPFRVDFDVPENNTTLYATFANATAQTFLQPLLAVFKLSLISFEARSINIPVVITEVAGATSYRITYEGPDGVEVVAVSGVTTLQHNIVGVDPDTTYTVRLLADTGSGFELSEETTVTTLPNVATSFNAADFANGNGVFNLSSLSVAALSTLSPIFNDIFSTGDIVSVSVETRSDLNASFIKLGDTLSIKEISGVLLPFTAESGAGQDVNVVLSDDVTSVLIAYDETANTLRVGEEVHGPSDSFILDGKKAIVLEV